MILAAFLDVAAAAAVALLAAGWLVVRAVRVWRGRTAGCGCAAASEKECPAASGMARDFRAAAARAVRGTRGPASR